MTDIYVGNLPFSTTQADLEGLFAPYSSVSRATIVTDRETGRSRGFGFVTLDDESAIDRAIAELHDSDFDGRALRVRRAEDRPPRNGGGGGGGGGRGGPRGGGGGRGGPRGGGGGGYRD
ncbi:MAG: RNA recognition motif domain-containing protein [Planctomycetota bacterium]